MKNKPQLILMSHGFMALEMLNSAKMIVGDVSEANVLSMAEADGLAGTTQKLEAILNKWDKNQEIIILTDLRGGTPCNVAMMKMQDYSNLKVLSGLNLGMLIEALMSPLVDVRELENYLLEIGRESVSKIEMPEMDADDEEYED